MKLFFLSSLIGMASGAQMIAFGDSWLTVGRAGLATIAAERGVTLDNIGVSGTTTTYWSSDANIRKITEALERSPEAEYMLIVNGGNDAQGDLPLNGNMDDLIKKMSANEAKTLDAIFAVRPNIKVVQYGYDVFAWDRNVICRALGTTLLSGEQPCNGGISNASCVNEYQARLHFEFVEGMSEQYTQVTSVNLLGTLQADANITGAAIGQPNNDFYTPGSYFALDCIHLTTPGYEILYGALFDRLP